MRQEFKTGKRRPEAAMVAGMIFFGVLLTMWSVLTALGVTGLVR